MAVVMALLALAGSAFFTFLVLLVPVNVLADTVSPPSYATSLKLGARSDPITKTVTISKGTPGTALVDVFFLADTTGSMGATLDAVKTGAATIMSNVKTALGDVAFGVGEYKDYDLYYPDPFVFRLNQDITKDADLVQFGINAWEALGGYDEPEGQLYALKQVADTVAWRPGSTRIIVWFGDVWGHDPAGPPPGVTETEAIAALLAQTIKVMALDVGSLNYTGQATRIAAATNGKYYSGIDPAQIATDIINSIIVSFQTYNTVSLGTSTVPAGLEVTVDPPSINAGEVPYDRSTERTFTFTVTFKALSPGSYSFTIPLLVDGGTMAFEQDDILVGGLLGFPLPGYTPYTAPVSAVMDNSVLERTPIEFYVPGNVIKAFNGETGRLEYGSIYLDPWKAIWLAFKNSTGTGFFPPSASGVRPLNYINGPYLSYSGMPGYNYDVPAGTPVLATADGKLYKAVTDPVNGAGYDVYNNSYIDHQNGFFSWYLYAPLTPAILAEMASNPDGHAQVTKGQVIGYVAPSGYDGIADRLHFEVRCNGNDNQNVVDPYKLGLWLTNGAHLEGALMLLFEETPPPIGY
jgi:hypothetical protein